MADTSRQSRAANGRPPIGASPSGSSRADRPEVTPRECPSVAQRRWRVGHHAFLRVFGIGVALALLLVGGLNIFVDPLETWRPTADSWTRYRTRALGREGKAEVAATTELDAAIVGDSRALIALNPRDEALQSLGRVHNLAFARATIAETCQMVQLVLQQHAPRTIIWAIDPESLIVPASGTIPKGAGFEQSRLAPRTLLVQRWAGQLWSWETTQDSLRVLRRAFRDDGIEVHAGQWAGPARAREPRQQFLAGLPPERIRAVYPTVQRVHSARSRDRSSPVRDLGRTLARLRTRGVQVQLVVLPVHALHQDRLLSGPSAEGYATGYQTLALLVDSLNRARLTGPALELWDFTSFEGYCAEPVPRPGQREPAQYFVDTMHPRERLGHEVLLRLTDSSEQDRRFGRRVTVDMLERQEDWLARRRASFRERLAQTEPGFVRQ